MDGTSHTEFGRRIVVKSLTALAACLAGGPSFAQSPQVELSVAQWGQSLYGLPFAVAMAKDFFKKAGIDVTDIIGSGGGGTTVRNTLAGKFPYGEVAASAALAAKRSGLDIVLVNMGTHSVAEASVVVLKDSPIRSPEALIGKKVAITSPRSTSEMLLIMALQAKGIDVTKVERVISGGYGQGLTMLDHDAVAAASLIEPLSIMRQDKYRPLMSMKDILPQMATSFGIVPRSFAQKNADGIKAVIAGRRTAVKYIYDNPDEAFKILAKTFSLEPAVAETACGHMVASHMWSEGEFRQAELDRIEAALRLVGEITAPIDWTGLIDRNYLPSDLQNVL